MKKKFILAAIGGSLIAAFLFYHFRGEVIQDERCAQQGYYWKGRLQSKSQGTFSFGKDNGTPLQTTAEYSGELRIKKTSQGFLFQWLNPEYQLSFGLSTQGISSKNKDAFSQFIHEPWGIENQNLKVSASLRDLNMDEKLLALNLIRKISYPFLSPSWKVEKNHSQVDTAEHSMISMTDYWFSSMKGCQLDKITVYEQAGGNYLKPWSTTETSYVMQWTLFESSFELKNPIYMPLQLNNGYENEKASRGDVAKNEVAQALQSIEKHSGLLRQMLKLEVLSYQDFEIALNAKKVNESDYKSGIAILVELETEESMRLLLSQLKKNKAVLYSILSLKRVTAELYQWVVKIAKANPKDQNIQLITCHFAGLYSNRFPEAKDRLDFLRPFLTENASNLPCLGNAGVDEAERIALIFIQNADVSIRKQAILLLRFIRTPEALAQIMRAVSRDDVRSEALEALRDRVERGILEADLWRDLISGVSPKSTYKDFALQLGKSFIMNFPGAFRDSKKEPQVKEFWKTK